MKLSTLAIASIVVAILIWVATAIGPHTFGQRCIAKGYAEHSDEHDACVRRLKEGK